MIVPFYILALFFYHTYMVPAEEKGTPAGMEAQSPILEESGQSLQLEDGTSIGAVALGRENRNFNLEIKTEGHWQLHEAFLVLDSSQTFTYKLDFEEEFTCLLPQNLDGEEVDLKMELELIQQSDENLVRFATLTRNYKIPYQRAPKKRAQF